ncbi:hypothetical protein RB195_018589 [Necator americanus]|uniref:Pao retrotransposon peptidase n=1 Tax=Necator americanus TaxID=51031 RepID=A0ABR1CAF6_NECAM
MDDAGETQVNTIRATVSDDKKKGRNGISIGQWIKLGLKNSAIPRKRIGQIAIISDVEKTSLQVRLQKVDRDATRCLWLRDHNSSPTLDNIQTFRFTRVTFGIKSSPFLLAGTTYYHLDNHTEEAPLCQKIKKNSYVDNLILTTDTLEDAVNIYDKSKQLFQEIYMDLRELTSNNTRLMEVIKESDKSTQQCPKVLGIVWDESRDMIQLSCHPPIHSDVTKRRVMGTIAAIYDPLGWLVSLLHQAKVFLRDLWRQQYDWDTPLPADKQQEWHQITNFISGFEKNLPRFLAPKGSTNLLVTFSDASSNTIAACVYLYQDNRANLIMAKSKLPSIQVQYTLPKLELNAMTLAMRLTNSYFFNLHLLVRFGYVASHDNPADCGTRGPSKDEFTTHFWWTGPQFLELPPSD